MANPVLGKLQGQGLIETTTAGLQQAGAQLATTPVGAALQGRGPDSLKMAGTPPAKINAMAAGMKDVSSVALSQLRETSRLMQGTDAEKAQAERVQKASVLGRVDNQIAQLAQNKLIEKLKLLTFDGAQLDKTKLPGYDDTKISALTTSLSDLIKGGADLTGSDITTINDALAVVGEAPLELDPTKPINTNILANKLVKLFTDKSKEELQGTISKAMLDARNESTIGALDDAGIQAIFATPNEDESQTDLVNLISSLTGKSAEDVKAMKLSDIRSAIDNWKTTEFKDVEALRKTLDDPAASRAERELAVKELRRLGQVGVTGAEAKAGDLQKQMQEGDTIKLGTEEWSFDELFSDPTKLAQMQTWIDNPDTAPPELKDWLSKNQDALALKVNELIGGGATGLAGAVSRVQNNATAIKLPDNVQVDEKTMESYFPGFSKAGLDLQSEFLDPTAKPDAVSGLTPAETVLADTIKKDATKVKQIADAGQAAVTAALAKNPALTVEEQAAIRKTAEDAQLKNLMLADANYLKAQKYKLLQDAQVGPNVAALMTKLRTIAGVDGTKLFNDLTYDQLVKITKNDFDVIDFTTAVTHQNYAKNFSPTADAFAGEFSSLMRVFGDSSTSGQLANLVGKDLTPYLKIFEAAGLTGDKSIIKDGKLDVNKLTNMIKGMGTLSTDDLINKKTDKIRTDLSKIVTTLIDEFGKAPSRHNKGAQTPEAREELFRNETASGMKPQKLLEWYQGEENKANQEYITTKQKFDEDAKYATMKQPSLPIRGRFEMPDAYQRRLDEYNDLVNKISNAKKSLNDSRIKMDFAKKRYDSAAQSRTTYEKDFPKKVLDWEEKYKTWSANYDTRLANENAKIDENYDALSKLLRGA
jgi:hypothetical protein